MNISGEAIHVLLEDRCRGDIDWCQAYGEPGYSDPERGILFANWNHVDRTIQDWLEHHGYALEWSDEWVISHETNKAYRSSPDCYSWRPSYVLTEDGEIIGADEVQSGDQVDAYIEHLLNNDRAADTFDVDWAKHGFRKLNQEQYESGFHPGQTDDPRKILKAAQEQYPDHDFLFSLDEAGQFDVRFSLWMREAE